MKKLLIILVAPLFLMTAQAQEASRVTEQMEVTLHDAVAVPQFSLFEIYCAGNPLFMSLITLCLVGVFLAAWRMPSRVKELGLLAHMLGIVSFLVGIFQANSVLMQTADISPVVISGGLMAAVIAPIWGCAVYCISLVVRLIQKPKTI